LDEEWLASSDPETKIEQMLRKIAEMQKSLGCAGQMQASLNGLKENLEELFACLPERCISSDGIVGLGRMNYPSDDRQFLQDVRDAAVSKNSEIEIQMMTKAIAAVPTSIVITDLLGNIKYVNASLLKKSGFRDISEVIGRSVFDFTNAEGKVRLQEEVLPALNSVGQWQGELFLERPDGQSYMAEMICALVKDDCGKPINLLANFYNITDRKRAEEALLLDDSRLEALQRLNQMDEASIKEIIDFALEAGVKLTGSKLGYLAFVDDEEKTLFMHSWSKWAMQTCNIEHKRVVYHLQETGLWGEAIRQRKAVITNDYASCPQRKGIPEGHVDVVRHMNVPITDKGKIVIVAGLGNKDVEYDDSDVRQLTLLMSGMWKIIQRRKAEEALRESQRALSTLMSNLPGMAYRCKNDRRWTMEFVSEGCLDLTGYRSNELLKNAAISYADLIHPDDQNYVWDEIQEAVANRRHFRLVYRIRSRYGIKWVWEQGQGIFLPDGVLLALEGFVNDITERKLAEESLKKTQEELEMRVSERTGWLLRANAALQEEMVKHKETEIELRSAQQAADTACRAKSEFLANMSHEIRTPMNAVIGLAGLLLETNLSEEQRDFVETIHSSGDALLAIINDILDFSKIDESKMKLEHLPFILRDCIESSLDMVAAKAAQKGLNLTYAIDEEIAPTILGDSVRLRQVLANLLSNAVKFTEKGRIAIHVQPGENADEIHFSVLDTGIGISSEDLKKLFLSFSQVDASTSRKYGGTGLGLAISKRLVELMGGRIWVQSKLCEGSTFHFLISAAPFSGEAAKMHLAGKKIMALLSSEGCLKELLDYARIWGMLIYPVVSAFEARELAESRFDAAILDSDVPGAEELAEEIGERLPTITLARPGQHRAGKKTLIKPFSQASILFALQEALMPPIHKKVRTCSSESMHPDLAILLAEDNPVNQKVARLMLKKLGYRADLVSNGREVLQAVLKKTYDVILMDVQMPEMDGLEATRAILDLNLKNRPKILAMTAYALEGDKERCLLAGMDGYISKPVQREELRRALLCLKDYPLCGDG
jgi:PAS domain S-box-containing protein